MKKSREKKRYSSLRAYASFIATFKGRFLTVVGSFTVANILLALLPLVIGQFVAALTEQPVSSDRVYWLVGVLIFISVAHDLAWRSGEWLYRGLLNSKLYEFENVIFQSIITKPYPYFIDKFTGKISTYVTGISREFRDFISEFCYEYVDLIVKLPIITVIMFSVNSYTGVVFVSSLLIMLVGGKRLIGNMVSAERQLTNTASNLDGYVIDVISNFVSVKAFKREHAEVKVVNRKREGVIEDSKHMMFWSNIFWAAMSFMVRWVTWPATLLLNVYLFLHGDIDLAQMTTFISALLVFSDYIWVVVWHASQMNVKLGRIEESYQYLFGNRNVVREFSAGQHAVRKNEPTPDFQSSFELRSLQFAYPDKPQQPVLSDISLTIKKNEKLGIVGASGSGKTTLIKLLLGYYGLPNGMVAVDGQVIDSRALVKLIAYVPQDTALFHRTIGENIAYGSDKVVEQSAIELAAERAHAHEFISQIDEGYEAVVGERGIKLSMGQRQRVAIARAFLDDKPLLILDEATSALDSESEVLVQKALEDLWHDRTVIAIAHRLSTLRNMDRIVVMDQGRIIEQGTHQQLLEKKGRYYRLWQHQSGGILIEE